MCHGSMVLIVVVWLGTCKEFTNNEKDNWNGIGSVSLKAM